MKKYSKEWVLQDTINFYTLENRALNSLGKCAYLTEDGKRCAIGRYLKKGQKKILKEYYDSVLALMNDDFFEKSIPKWMFKLPNSFLYSIQVLHDNRVNWTNTGLSETGIKKVKVICEEYHIDFKSLTIKQ